MKIKIAKCSCTHEFQDRTYGPQMRVMNATGKMDRGDTHRCTVCGKEHGKEFKKETKK